MTDFRHILDLAHQNARDAVVGLPDRWACGFAWVTIDGNSPLARWARKQPHGQGWDEGGGYYGDKGDPKGYYGDKGDKGWQWWSPGYRGQSIDNKEKAARAFRDTLAEFGIVATVGSRLD